MTTLTFRCEQPATPFFATAAAAARKLAARNDLKVAATIVAAPLIGLAFVTLVPIAGLAYLLLCGLHAAARSAALRNIALFLAAPFVGLAYIVLMPLVGFGALAALALRATVNARRAV
jgi:hypothetical protein